MVAARILPLRAHGLEPGLGNARDVRHLTGWPKTDVLDLVWLCKVAERQMLRASFVPPGPIRQLQDPGALRLTKGPLLALKSWARGEAHHPPCPFSIQMSVVVFNVSIYGFRRQLAVELSAW